MLPVVIVDDDVRGALDEVVVADPWWPETAPLIDAVAERDGTRVRVVRLQAADGPPPGGDLTVLIEPLDPSTLPVLGRTPPGLDALADHPYRAPYARPGGAAADEAWALGHVTPTGPVRQVRSWNLSHLFVIPTAAGLVHGKAVPWFFAHEAAVLEALAGHAVPPLLAGEPGRSLTAHVPGEDGYHVGDAGWAELADVLVELQWERRTDLDDWFACGVPDRRAEPLAAELNELVQRQGNSLDPVDADALAGLAADLDARFDRAGGFPDVLVHGDAHPGNSRWNAEGVVLMDWADAVVGHPLLDLGVLSSYHEAGGHAVTQRWLAAWAQRLPAVDVAAAWDALRPVAELRSALVFDEFCRRVEPVERLHHAGDVLAALRRAARAARAARS